MSRSGEDGGRSAADARAVVFRGEPLGKDVIVYRPVADPTLHWDAERRWVIDPATGESVGYRNIDIATGLFGAGLRRDGVPVLNLRGRRGRLEESGADWVTGFVVDVAFPPDSGRPWETALPRHGFSLARFADLLNMHRTAVWLAAHLGHIVVADNR